MQTKNGTTGSHFMPIVSNGCDDDDDDDYGDNTKVMMDDIG